MKDGILGLHNDWWANLTALACVHTEWVNVAISGKMGVISLLGMGNCSA
jgi:hypothetical protein